SSVSLPVLTSFPCCSESAGCRQWRRSSCNSCWADFCGHLEQHLRLCFRLLSFCCSFFSRWSRDAPCGDLHESGPHGAHRSCVGSLRVSALPHCNCHRRVFQFSGIPLIPTDGDLASLVSRVLCRGPIRRRVLVFNRSWNRGLVPGHSRRHAGRDLSCAIFAGGP